MDALEGASPMQSGWRAHGGNALDALLRNGIDNTFPALSGTISEINRIVADDSEGPQKLARVILQDVALTEKLLKLVNTVSYGQFGGHINTISKAVVILGFETVRNVAMTLILLEFLQNKPQAAQLKEEIIASFFAGVLALSLSQGTRVHDSEEVMICAMFQRLGKLLGLFYFYEDCQRVTTLTGNGMDEAEAAQQVLGISYDELGQGIARHWSFPDRMLAGMKKASATGIAKPRNELERINLTANLASELCELASTASVDTRELALQELAQRYAAVGGVDAQQLSLALEQGLQELSQRASAIGLATTHGSLLQAITLWCEQTEDTATSDNASELEEMASLGRTAEIEESAPEEPVDAEAMLTAGIQEVTNALVGDCQLNEILQMVLETMYRAMKFNRIAIFVHDARTGQMHARHGFGQGIDALLPEMQFSLKPSADVFHVALEKGVDVVIADAMADNIASKIPAWHRSILGAHCFFLLPVMINQRALALVYADMQAANSLQISRRELSLMRTLRNQIVLAVKHNS
ncbi:MAG: HDOD domain-containing protein [Haliea sp.]